MSECEKLNSYDKVKKIQGAKNAIEEKTK